MYFSLSLSLSIYIYIEDVKPGAPGPVCPRRTPGSYGHVLPETVPPKCGSRPPTRYVPDQKPNYALERGALGPDPYHRPRHPT